jgi:bifunctional DNA-binding transcriptional regulator/antitoxin component of YhaV-PrlF toxin-antitoxin module
VHASGVILLGKTYAADFGLKPGDELEIVLDADCIKLVPASVKPVATSAKKLSISA